MSDPELSTHHYRMQTGQYKGQLITRVPAKALLGMVRGHHQETAYAEAELARRGTVIPVADVSGHAIDRASQGCMKLWKKHRQQGEGLYAWLVRMTIEAIEHGHPRGDRIAYNGMLLAIDNIGAWPVLKTVIKDDRPRKDLRPMRVRDDEEEIAT